VRPAATLKGIFRSASKGADAGLRRAAGKPVLERENRSRSKYRMAVMRRSCAQRTMRNVCANFVLAQPGLNSKSLWRKQAIRRHRVRSGFRLRVPKPRHKLSKVSGFKDVS